MAVAIKQSLVQSKNYKLKCPHPMTPEYITIHNTYNDASAANEIQYMVNSPREISYHFAVDDKEVIQGVLLDRNAWHCGDGGNGTGNRKSIGIEICYSKSGGTKYYQAEGLAIQLVAQLLNERGWGVDRVKKHEDWSGKHCPHRILDEGRWNSFKQAIVEEMKPKVTTKKEVEQVSEERALNEKELAIQKEAVRLGITDGKNPLREVNQMYVWSALIPLAKKVEALEKK